MKLLAIKDISPQLPEGSTFEQANASDGNILIALGLAREVRDVQEPQSDPSPTRRGRYRTRVLRADE